MGTGGMRYGAGRPGYRLTAESSKRIDVRRWHKGGFLRAGNSFSWAWTANGEASGNIGVTRNSAGVWLCYGVKNGDQWRDASQQIDITTTACHLGGSRPWFTCPACRGRGAVLYLRSGRFACRKCQRMAYRSQSGSATDRLCNLFHKLAAKVEEGKPKGQRWATFNRLCDRYEAVGQAFDATLLPLLSRLGVSHKLL